MAFLILPCLEIRRLSFVSSFLLLLLLLALFSVFAPCNTHEEEESSRSSISLQQYQREFDYFVLALQWPATLCQGTRYCCSSNACCRRSNAPTGFTIHGLWADYIDGTWPACCSNDRFDIKEVKPLLEGLQKYWPSLRCGSTATCHGRRGLFWAHEWEKHGTCATSVLRDEYSYFLTTLNLYLKYNITEILNEAGYPPSNTEEYPLGGVISAIENAIRATPLVVCSHGAVSEIRICFYKNFKPLDCTYHSSSNDNVVASSSCPRYISLPEYVPIGLGSNVSIPWLPSTEVM